MASPANPAETRAYILERLVGDTGEPDHIVEAGKSLGERAVPAMLDAFGQVFPSTFGVELKSVELARFADAKPEDPTSHAMTIASSTSSPDAMLFLLDGAALAVIVSSVFGGDPDMAIAPLSRALSPTELEIASTVFQNAADVLNGSGPRAFNLRFPLAPAMSGVDIKKQIVRDGPAVRVDFAIFTAGGRGVFSVFLPQRVLLKHRGDATATSGDQSSEWRDRFNEEVMRSVVALEARMPLSKLTLGEVAGFQEGMLLELEEGAQASATLSSRGKTLYVCEFGKLGQNYTVRIRHPFDAGQDLIDTLMPA
jgi:flagellar motor switch protein FliM